MTFGLRLLDLLERSVIMQGLAMCTCLALVSYLALTERQIPPLVSDLTLLVFGFYFGAKSTEAAIRASITRAAAPPAGG
jgi:hypothetical protein